jgi:hypothetical protein
MFMVEVKMNQDQLIRTIEQELDNLSYFNEMLFNCWCDELYDENSEPIVEKFTPTVLTQIQEDVYNNDW